MTIANAPDSRRGALVARVIAATLLSGVIVMLWGAQPAGAHASLVGTEPAADETLESAPPVVELEFDEPMEVGPAGVRVLDPDGTRVDNEGSIESEANGRRLVVPFDGSEIGTYTVSWRVVSSDGHTIEGSFVFHIGEPRGGATLDEGTDVVAEIAGWVGRWLAFTGGILVLGGALFLLLVVRQVPESRRLGKVMIAASVAALVGTVLTGIARSAQVSGRSLIDVIDVLPEMVRSTRPGRLDAIWVGIAAVLIVAVLLRAVRTRKWPIAVIGIAFMSVPAFAGHAWTASPTALAVTTDIVHVVAVAIWVGGLVALLAVNSGAADDDLAMVRRFSQVALFAAGITVLSGSVSAWLEVGSLEALFQSTYGRLLLAKVGGVAALLVLGYINRVRLLGIAARVVDLLRNVRFEVAIAVVVVALTAVLVTEPPGRSYEPPAGPSAITVTFGDGSLDLSVSPAQTGPNLVHLTFLNSDGGPSDMDAVEVQVSTDGVPPRRIALITVTANHYIAEGVALSPAGTWQFDITAVRRGDPITETIEVPIS